MDGTKFALRVLILIGLLALAALYAKDLAVLLAQLFDLLRGFFW